MRKTPTDHNDKPRVPIKITKCGQMKLKSKFTAGATSADSSKEEKKEGGLAGSEDSAGDNRGVKAEGGAAASSTIMDRSKGIKKDKKKKKHGKDKRSRM